MKSNVSQSIFARIFRASAISGLLLLSSFLTVNGQTTTFAQFFEKNGTQDFVFTNNTTSGDFNTIGGGSPVDFKYFNLPGLDAQLQGFQNAHLTITTTTTMPGVSVLGTVTQPLNQQVTVAIIRDAAATVGRNSRTNLLTAVFTPAGNTPGITGGDGGNSANLSATTPGQNVIFTSDFLLFHQTTNRNLGLTFSSVNPSLALGAGSFLQNFTAAGTGTFASNPLPTLPGPTAAGVSLSGKVSTSSGRGVRNAEVVLVSSDGTIRSARTSSFGYFEITDITSGQTVVVSVLSKRYSFPTRTISLQDNATEIDFVANP